MSFIVLKSIYAADLGGHCLEHAPRDALGGAL